MKSYENACLQILPRATIVTSEYSPFSLKSAWFTKAIYAQNLIIKSICIMQYKYLDGSDSFKYHNSFKLCNEVFV